MPEMEEKKGGSGAELPSVAVRSSLVHDVAERNGTSGVEGTSSVEWPFDRPLILATGSYEGGYEVEGPGRRRASGHSGGG